MRSLKIILFSVLFSTQIGCSELSAYVVGTLGNITGDLVVNELERREKEKEKEQEKEPTTTTQED